MLHALVIGKPFVMNGGIDRCRDKLHFTRLHDYSPLVSNGREQGKISTSSRRQWPQRVGGPIDAAAFDMTHEEY